MLLGVDAQPVDFTPTVGQRLEFFDGTEGIVAQEHEPDTLFGMALLQVCRFWTIQMECGGWRSVFKVEQCH